MVASILNRIVIALRSARQHRLAPRALLREFDAKKTLTGTIFLSFTARSQPRSKELEQASEFLPCAFTHLAGPKALIIRLVFRKQSLSAAIAVKSVLPHQSTTVRLRLAAGPSRNAFADFDKTSNSDLAREP
jgi:hypothetical protein